MPQILLAGAPTGCWTNLGDEAILATMAASLRAAVPGVQLAVVSSNPPGFLDGYGCDGVDFRDLDAILEAVHRADLVVLGGGSIFFDYWGADPAAVLTPRHQGVELWAGLALLAQATGTPVLTYGVGVGPLRTEGGRLLAAAALETATVATLRDQGSLRAMAELGVTHPDVQVTGDPVIRWQLGDVERLGDRGPVVGVALRNWDIDVDQEHWQEVTARALGPTLDRFAAHAVFVPFHRDVRWPLSDDTAAGEAVRSRLGAAATRTSAVSIDEPWHRRAAVLGGCDVVLAMRYHAALLALSAGAAPVALSYDPKVAALLTESGFGDLVTPLDRSLRASALEEQLARAVEDCDELGARAAAAGAQLREREAATVQRAAEVLEGPLAPRPLGAAGRALLDVLDSSEQPADRPVGCVQALEALRAGTRAAAPVPTGAQRAAPAPAPERRAGAPTVAILTNRLLDRATGEPCIGGAERYALDLAELLRDLGLDVTFYQRGGVWGTGTYFGFPVHALPEGGEVGEFEVGVAERFAEASAEADHVLVLSPNYAAGPLRDDAVVVCHGVWWDHDLWEHLTFRTPDWYAHLEQVFTRASAVVSVDDNSVDVVRALFPSAAARMHVIPNAVDTTTFHPPPSRDRVVPQVLLPRRADVIRGPQLVGPLLDQVPDPCAVLWVGDGDPAMLAALAEVAARDPRLAHRTASLDEMPALYRDADIVVIPTVASEGQSLACLEAMASGCAVVTTRVGGLDELVTDGVDGLVCDPTPESLAAALRRVVRDPALRHRLGTAARASALRHARARWRSQWAALLRDQGWVAETTPAVPYDIVCFGIIDWSFRYQRPQQMMTAWGRRGRRVFYVRVTDFLDEAATDPVALEEVAPNVYEVRLALPSFDVYDGTLPDGLVDAGMRALRALVHEQAIHTAVAVVELATWEPLASAARATFGWPVVYDCMDDWTTFPGFDERPSFLAHEEALVARADGMVVSSDTIRRRWEPRRPDLVLARNAADFEFFHAAAGADPLPDVPGPIAGFFGAVVEWFDVDLLAHAARQHPEVTFVLVGNVARVDVAALEALPNVRFEGLQPYEAMPAYLRRFDVALVPFVVGPATDGMDVVKFYEYVSQGTPVVSTRITEIVPYDGLLYLAEGPAEFSEQLRRALDEDDATLRARRLSLARCNTWDDRLDVVEGVILDCLARAGDLAPTSPQRAATPAAPAARPRPSAPDADLLAERAVLVDRLDALERSRAVKVAKAYWKGKELTGRLVRRVRR